MLTCPNGGSFSAGHIPNFQTRPSQRLEQFLGYLRETEQLLRLFENRYEGPDGKGRGGTVPLGQLRFRTRPGPQPPAAAHPLLRLHGGALGEDRCEGVGAGGLWRGKGGHRRGSEECLRHRQLQEGGGHRLAGRGAGRPQRYAR